MALSLAYPAPTATGQDATGEGDCRFPDVPATNPAHADVTHACQKGWFTGYPDGSFHPDRPVPAHQIATVVGRAFPSGATRSDMAVFLRGGNPGDPATPARFPDVPATHPRNEDIAYAVEQSWFQGYPDGAFRPDQIITATQITTVLQRAFPTASTRAQLATFMRHGQQALNAQNEPQPQPSPSKIAYEVPVYDSLGEKVARELWVASSDGSGTRRLTDDVRYYHYEDYEDQFGDWEWSPGGERIAYEVTVRDFRGNETGSELWVADADGSGARQITDEVGGGWEWSPGEERIAYNIVTEWNSYGGIVSKELWVAEVDGSDTRQLVDDVWHWGWSPSGEQIVFGVVTERSSWGSILEYDLWVVGADGSGRQRLTHGVSVRGGWEWSPDGDRISFTVSGLTVPGYDSFGYEVPRELWVASLDDSAIRRLTGDIDIKYFINGEWWSPDGERIVYEVKENSRDEGATSELWVVGIDGSAPRRLTNDFAYNWMLSPSGELIAYQSRIWEFGRWLGYGLWVADTDGSNQRQIDKDIAYSWEWSPSKETIAYGVKKRDPRRTVVNTELWVASADGSSTRKLTDDISEEGWGWRWSPDGESIAYEVNVGGSSDSDRELWVASADGSRARRLAEDVDHGWWWSPDGKRIAYVVERDSNGEGRELWVVGVDGSDAHLLVNDVAISEGGWLWCTWMDEESIFYDVGDSPGSKRELWVVRVDGSGVRRLTSDVALTGWIWRVWGRSPSGEEFAYGVTVRDSGGNETSTELWVAVADGSRARKIADDVHDLRWQPVNS